ncbi:MAG: MBL fold metallo-hydrolase [Promethearchaeota archaeon]
MKKIVNNVFVVKPYVPNSMDCCVYLIDTKSDDGLVLIDVGLDIEPIQEIEKKGFNLNEIKNCLITHGHLDHIGACNQLKSFSKDIKFYAHELDAEKIEQIPTDPYVSQYYADYKYEPIKLTRKFKVDNEILKFGKVEIKCIHIPGHTPGSVAYLLETGNKKILFGGDLPGSAINTRGGDLDAYLKSMQKLLDLNVDILCEGHEDIIKPAKKAAESIKLYMKLNKNINLIALEDPFNKEALLELTIQSYKLKYFDNALDFCQYLLEIDPDNSSAQQLLKKIKKHNPPKMEYIKGLIQENFPELSTQIHEEEQD